MVENTPFAGLVKSLSIRRRTRRFDETKLSLLIDTEERDIRRTSKLSEKYVDRCIGLRIFEPQSLVVFIIRNISRRFETHDIFKISDWTQFVTNPIMNDVSVRYIDGISTKIITPD
jgi:hypothetical protein